jgi:UDP-2,4-diacetamido-2,4,6-trideoxy-beta-L-altropyranose hydrolase
MRLRTATLDDAGLLLDWRNDAETRANSHQHDAVPWDIHMAWLAAVLGDPARELLIAECDGMAVGTVRFDRDRDGTVLSWTIAPARRGLGLGRAMVRCAIERAPAARLRVEITASNARSIAIARATGFRMSETIGDITVWRRP